MAGGALSLGMWVSLPSSMTVGRISVSCIGALRTSSPRSHLPIPGKRSLSILLPRRQPDCVSAISKLADSDTWLGQAHLDYSLISLAWQHRYLHYSEATCQPLPNGFFFHQAIGFLEGNQAVFLLFQIVWTQHLIRAGPPRITSHFISLIYRWQTLISII